MNRAFFDLSWFWVCGNFQTTREVFYCQSIVKPLTHLHFKGNQKFELSLNYKYKDEGFACSAEAKFLDLACIIANTGFLVPMNLQG
jgi:hypothetical protein